MIAPNLESERLLYRPLSLEHLSQRYVDWLNDPHVNRFLETGGDYTLEVLERFLRDVEIKGILFWAIHTKVDNNHIGNIKIDPVNERHGLGEYGILMGARSEWGKGYAKEASQTIIDYCFNVLKLRKITLGVVEQNAPAVNLYRSLNFVTEGTYKAHGIYGGVYCDVFRMALFNPILK